MNVWFDFSKQDLVSKSCGLVVGRRHYEHCVVHAQHRAVLSTQSDLTALDWLKDWKSSQEQLLLEAKMLDWNGERFSFYWFDKIACPVVVQHQVGQCNIHDRLKSVLDMMCPYLEPLHWGEGLQIFRLCPLDTSFHYVLMWRYESCFQSVESYSSCRPSSGACPCQSSFAAVATPFSNQKVL